MKIVTIAFFMNMSNDVSYSHDTKCRIQTCKIKDLKDQGYNPASNLNEDFDYFANTSLQLTAKIDIIRFFKDNSRHAFKIGGGYGVIRYQKAWSHFRLNDDSKFEYELATTSNFGLLGSFKLGYEYEILPKFKIGATFGGTFYPALSILLRKDF